MQREGTRGVGQTRNRVPDLPLVGIGLELTPECAEVAVEHGRQVGGEGDRA